MDEDHIIKVIKNAIDVMQRLEEVLLETSKAMVILAATLDDLAKKIENVSDSE